jgi:cephalosporin-C deacetylase-like acetyl esterase
LAQPASTLIEVNVIPDHDNWLYKTGEKVKFTLRATKNDVLLKDVDIRYEISEDMMPALKKGALTSKNGNETVDAGTMKTPGFLRCIAYITYDGKDYQGMATAGFDPEKIVPTTTLPDDFDQFWEKAKADNSKIPMDAVVTLMPDRCTSKVNVYQVSLQNFRIGARLYGILCVPKAPGKYPAVLKVPGAGVRPYAGDISTAERGFITFEIGIHGIPVDLPASVYRDMNNGILNNYWGYFLDNKDSYFYKRVYVGCVRSVDFIYSLPEFDGNNLFVTGGSQGGALSIVSAALDQRIKGLAAFYPALSDLTGYLFGRAGGWPHMFRNVDKNDKVTAAKIETSRYYDVANFARQIRVPGFYAFGYNDMVCPPTSMFSAYNVITAPKELIIAEETGHWAFPEQWSKSIQWIENHVSGR